MWPNLPTTSDHTLEETSLKPVMDPCGTTLVQLVWWQVPCAARYLGAEAGPEQVCNGCATVVQLLCNKHINNIVNGFISNIYKYIYYWLMIV